MIHKTSIRWIGLFVLLFFAASAQAQHRNKQYLAYISQYREIAIEQMDKYKIPASITLAQGLLESGAGKSSLARKSNNHFGIKCGGRWKGKSVRYDDDAPRECFRAYSSVRESYIDHSKFLVSGPRYAFLFRLDITDYKGWARGLKKAGYATDPSYANRLIQIIEDYSLYKYDVKESKRKSRKKKQMVPHEVYLANGLLYVKARRGDTFEAIAKEFKTKAKRLIKYNDLHKDYTLSEGDIVYLHEKKKKADKKYDKHIVGDNDSMHGISQMYGIRLKYLYKMNKKDPEDYIPEVGDCLRLR